MEAGVRVKPSIAAVLGALTGITLVGCLAFTPEPDPIDDAVNADVFVNEDPAPVPGWDSEPEVIEDATPAPETREPDVGPWVVATYDCETAELSRFVTEYLADGSIHDYEEYTHRPATDGERAHLGCDVDPTEPEVHVRPADGTLATGPVWDYDTGVLYCGVGGVVAVGVDEYENQWAYCEPALSNGENHG